MNRARAALGHFVLAAAIGPLTAIQVPQTRQEFVDAVAAGAGATATEKLAIDRYLPEIVQSFKRWPAGKNADCPKMK